MIYKDTFTLLILKTNLKMVIFQTLFVIFFKKNGCFPGSQRLIIIPKPKIPNFIKTEEVISPNQLFEKFKSSDARGLVSFQALAALSIFFWR